MTGGCDNLVNGFKAHHELVTRFERLDLATLAFSRADHIAVALSKLNVYDYVGACSRYARTICAMTLKHGVSNEVQYEISCSPNNVVMRVHQRKMHPTPRSSVYRERCLSYRASLPILLRRRKMDTWLCSINKKELIQVET